MKTLIVYYSRSGTTRKVAEYLAESLKADIEEIKDGGRKGLFGWLRSGKEGFTKTASKIEDVKKFPGNYDITIIGTPVWAGNMASPIRSYMEQFGDRIEKTAFFCTCGSSEGTAFIDLRALTKKKPLATLALRMKDVKADVYKEKANLFIEEINKPPEAEKNA
jgi:flavodoxin